MVDDRLRAIDVIEASLDEPETTGSDLADRAYLSRFHFDRLVSAALGEPPGGFRRRLLLERSAHQLVTVDTPVIDVAMDAGYASPEAFARAFARAYDVSPSDYRRGRPDRHDLPAAAGSISAHRGASWSPRPEGAPPWTSSSACSTTT